MAMPVRAILFDFNGTLSDDEAIQCAIFRELFAEAGKPLSETEYYEQLAGLSDPGIVETWLGEERDDIVAERVRRFHDRVAAGSTMGPAVREAVRWPAGHARLAVVSGAARSEVESVLGAAGLRDCFEALVTAEDVAAGKPDPAGNLRALDLLGLEPAAALAIEDTDEIAESLDTNLMQRLL